MRQRFIAVHRIVFIALTCLEDDLAATAGLQFQLHPRHYSRVAYSRTLAYIASQIYERKIDIRARKIYGCSWQDENIKIRRIPASVRYIENPENNTPPISSLWAKLSGIYAFGSSWEKHDGADKKKSPHIIEGSSCALYAAWKFHSGTSPQYSTP